jgi:prepilin-type N-terminal cleavage/methylation domain-containing protein
VSPSCAGRFPPTLDQVVVEQATPACVAVEEVGVRGQLRVGSRLGMTLIELVVVLAVSAILCSIVTPNAVHARRTFRAHDAARRLALVLREAQARAAASGKPVTVTVANDGGYQISEGRSPSSMEIAGGELGAPVSSNYPDGTIEFGSSGLPTIAGGSSPRAGHFAVADGAAGRTVVVQLGGCVRCV